jgi:dipeptidase
MIEMQLTHDGVFWVARNDDIEARARELPELDREVARQLGELETETPLERSVQVRMVFDRAVIPQWIRQYAGHYFNRVVTMDL